MRGTALRRLALALHLAVLAALLFSSALLLRFHLGHAGFYDALASGRLTAPLAQAEAELRATLQASAQGSIVFRTRVLRLSPEHYDAAAQARIAPAEDLAEALRASGHDGCRSLAPAPQEGPAMLCRLAGDFPPGTALPLLSRITGRGSEAKLVHLHAQAEDHVLLSIASAEADFQHGDFELVLHLLLAERMAE
ncbi:hypothetical protein [Pseudoroseomonas cervicalis]|uniref:hypothetical protein n=1 Tax=Teichococcus cervicalis TaxID=204525 RepID=UPI0022F1D88D|nr:hypothetical protein [Pseudoroseomonas cervicalis]WBV41595.1 hypothetical protein PFY06_10085 [Pseudoroseomonas cervicalis]